MGLVEDTHISEGLPGERIAKVIARSGLCSRRDAERLIGESRVSVNGRVLDSPAVNVSPDDQILVDGVTLPTAEPPRLWRFHKPKGRVTTHRDPEGRPTVFDGLPETMPRVISVGRLDYNTEGLLLLTNDGELARHLERPATGWLRRYRVRANGTVTQDQLDALADGITIDGINYADIEAKIDREQGTNIWLTVGIREGKNREVRRIMDHLGLVVNRLIRVSYGPFALGELEPGAVEEVRRRVLADQLGAEMAEQLGLRERRQDRHDQEGQDGEAPRRRVSPTRAAARPRKEPKHEPRAEAHRDHPSKPAGVRRPRMEDTDGRPPRGHGQTGEGAMRGERRSYNAGEGEQRGERRPFKPRYQDEQGAREPRSGGKRYESGSAQRGGFSAHRDERRSFAADGEQRRERRPYQSRETDDRAPRESRGGGGRHEGRSEGQAHQTWEERVRDPNVRPRRPSGDRPTRGRFRNEEGGGTHEQRGGRSGGWNPMDRDARGSEGGERGDWKSRDRAPTDGGNRAERPAGRPPRDRAENRTGEHRQRRDDSRPSSGDGDRKPRFAGHGEGPRGRDGGDRPMRQRRDDSRPSSGDGDRKPRFAGHGEGPRGRDGGDRPMRPRRDDNSPSSGGGDRKPRSAAPRGDRDSRPSPRPGQSPRTPRPGGGRPPRDRGPR